MQVLANPRALRAAQSIIVASDTVHRGDSYSRVQTEISTA